MLRFGNDEQRDCTRALIDYLASKNEICSFIFPFFWSKAQGFAFAGWNCFKVQRWETQNTCVSSEFEAYRRAERSKHLG